MSDNTPAPQRKYPKLYEKLVPIAIALLAFVILAMLVYTIAVATGLLNFG